MSGRSEIKYCGENNLWHIYGSTCGLMWLASGVVVTLDDSNDCITTFNDNITAFNSLLVVISVWLGLINYPAPESVCVCVCGENDSGARWIKDILKQRYLFQDKDLELTNDETGRRQGLEVGV